MTMETIIMVMMTIMNNDQDQNMDHGEECYSRYDLNVM